MRIATAALLPLLLIGCAAGVADDNATSAADPSDHLRAGRWSLSSTLGTPQGTRPDAEPPLVIPHCIGADLAAVPVREAILALSSRDRCTGKGPRFANGTISGEMTCQGMDDIPVHQERFSGSYSSEAFHLMIDMPVFGLVARQTIDARRIGDC